MAACGGVVDGVVGEGFDEGVDFGVVGSDAQVVFDGDADVLLFVEGEGHEFLQHAAELGLQADVGQVALGFGALGAGVGQELLEQVAVALYALEIVGYPNETEEDFEELKEFVRQMRFERLGCFTYSHEENTAAYELEDNIPEEEKQRRASEIMEIQS